MFVHSSNLLWILEFVFNDFNKWSIDLLFYGFDRMGMCSMHVYGFSGIDMYSMNHLWIKTLFWESKKQWIILLFID